MQCVVQRWQRLAAVVHGRTRRAPCMAMEGNLPQATTPVQQKADAVIMRVQEAARSAPERWP